MKISYTLHSRFAMDKSPLFLACWGSISYFYQEAKLDKEKKNIAENEEKKQEQVAEDKDQFRDVPEIVVLQN